jgi:hypothetical protein
LHYPNGKLMKVLLLTMTELIKIIECHRRIL